MIVIMQNYFWKMLIIFFITIDDDSRLGEINDNNDCLFRLVEDE